MKAAQCFNKARDGVANESFLRDCLLQADEPQIRKLEVLYYLKVSFVDTKGLEIFANRV